MEFQERFTDQKEEPQDNVQNQEEIEPSNQEGLRSYQLTRDKVSREIRRPARYDHANNISFVFKVTDEVESEDPITYKEAVTCGEKESWKKAMDEEMESLLKNQTWILVNKPNSIT